MFFNPILMIIAIVPAIWLMRYINAHDRVDKEPRKLLVLLVFLGIISTTCAAFTELIGINLVSRIFPEGSLICRILENFLVVGLSEEGFKYLLLKRATWKNPNFNCSFDAVVYSVFVSLGFALWENIQYVSQFGFATALIRAVTAVPGHCCFGVLMGAWYGLAKKRETQGDISASKNNLRLAVMVPAAVHGAYDFVAGSGNAFGALFFFVFVAVMFFVCYKMVKALSEIDAYMTPSDGNDNSDGVDFTYR